MIKKIIEKGREIKRERKERKTCCERRKERA